MDSMALGPWALDASLVMVIVTAAGAFGFGLGSSWPWYRRASSFGQELPHWIARNAALQRLLRHERHPAAFSNRAQAHSALPLGDGPPQTLDDHPTH